MKYIISKLPLLITAMIFSNVCVAQVMETPVSFATVTEIQDRQNLIRLIGTEKTTMNPLDIVLYSGISSFVSGIVPKNNFRCLPYMLKMLEEPGKYYLNLSVDFREDDTVFSGEGDIIYNCGLTLQ